MELEQKLTGVFSAYGYRRFRQAKFEPYDLYAAYRSFLQSRQIMTFTDLDGSLMALRPDITLSIMKNNPGEREKVYYTETVYRPHDGHWREIPQAGVECIGQIDAFQEAEILSMAADALGCVSPQWRLRVSDAGFLQQLFADLQLNEAACRAVTNRLCAKDAGGIRELARGGAISGEAAAILSRLAELYAPLPEGIRQMEQLAVTEAQRACAEHLAEVNRLLRGGGGIYLDFSLSGGMDYYNGLLFQGAVAEIPTAVLSGGRYDRLPQQMGKAVGAIGFAVYLGRVEEYLSERQPGGEEGLAAVYRPEEAGPAFLAAVRRLRQAGRRVITVPMAERPAPGGWRELSAAEVMALAEEAAE